MYQLYRDGLIEPRHNVGLKDHAPAIYKELYELRSTGVEISLPEFLILWGKQKVKSGHPVSETLNAQAFLSSEFDDEKVTIGELTSITDQNLKEIEMAFLHDLGIGDLKRVRIETLMGTEDMAGLLNERVREALIAGIFSAPIHQDLIATEGNAPARDVSMPTVDLDTGNRAQRTAEGETIPLGTATFTERTVRAKKFGRAIEIPYDMIWFATVDILSLFMERIGYSVGMEVDSEFCDVLINGDDADTSVMGAGVLGVANTTSKLQYTDLVHYWTWMAQRGIILNTLIGNTSRIEHIMGLPEFKDRQNVGDPLVKLKKNNLNLPSDANLFVKSTLTDTQIIALDSARAAVKFNVRPVLTESQKNIVGETEVAKVSFYAMIGNLWRDARIVIDEDHSRLSESTYMFTNYTYLQPLDLPA